MIRTAAAIAAIAVLTACGSSDTSADEPKTFTVHGRLVLLGEGAGQTGPCQGSDGFSDINVSTQVTVSDASGKKIAVGSLGEGESVGASNSNCRFEIAVGDVPAGEKLYTVQVGRRGERTYKQSELEKDMGSALDLTLGS
jgi:hypothetical protein